MRVMMIVASALSYFINEAVAKARYQNVDKMNYEAPLTSLVWLTSIISICATYAISYLMIPNLGERSVDVVEAFDDHHLRDAGGGDYSGVGQSVYLGGIEPC